VPSRRLRAAFLFLVRVVRAFAGVFAEPIDAHRTTRRPSVNERFRGLPPGPNVGTQRIVYRLLARPTPFAFPLMVEGMRKQVTTENLSARLDRMLAELEAAAL
jgi:hypothetical protein